LLALFKNRFNSQGPFAKALANNSFAVYLIHLPIIVFLQFQLIGVAIDPLIKFAIVGTLGISLSFAISHYVIRRLPYARDVLG
jgi:peptidoglycan/LPS O-acetylase OafA/YrhL